MNHAQKSLREKLQPVCQILALCFYGYSIKGLWWEHNLKINYHRWQKTEEEYWRIVHEFDANIHNPVSVFPEIAGNTNPETVYMLTRQLLAYYGVKDPSKDILDQNYTEKQQMNLHDYQQIHEKVLQLIKDEETAKDLRVYDNSKSKELNEFVEERKAVESDIVKAAETAAIPAQSVTPVTEFESLYQEENAFRDKLIIHSSNPPPQMINAEREEYNFSPMTVAKLGVIVHFLPKGWKWSPVVALAVGSLFVKLQ
jgi:hypothetical protein